MTGIKIQQAQQIQQAQFRLIQQQSSVMLEILKSMNEKHIRKNMHIYINCTYIIYWAVTHCREIIIFLQGFPLARFLYTVFWGTTN